MAPRKKAVAAVRERVTWMTPYWDDWKERFGGEPSAGSMARYLGPLVQKHGAEDVRKAWRMFLVAQDAQYVNMARFAQTYGTWTGKIPRAVGKADRAWVAAAEWASSPEPDHHHE